MCTIPDCAKPVLAKGYCNAHYKKWKKHGDPLFGETRKRESQIIIECEYARVELTQGAWALIDIEDIPKVKGRPWCLNDTGYAVTRQGKKLLAMQTAISGAPPDLLIDHIDRNKLNNRKQNLRNATCRENNLNSSRIDDAEGVYMQQATGRWSARLQYDYTQLHLGYFATKEEARIVYKQAVALIYPLTNSVEFIGRLKANKVGRFAKAA